MSSEKTLFTLLIILGLGLAYLIYPTPLEQEKRLKAANIEFYELAPKKGDSTTTKPTNFLF
jgi:hypothetical protein